MSCLIISFVLQSTISSGQEISVLQNPRFTSAPSPTAANLSEGGNSQIDLFSGNLQVSIPLYQIKTRNLSMPVSLTYNGGGNKVNASPGWVGLGWNLQAGGVITRKKNGVEDENIGGELFWPEESGGMTTYPSRNFDKGYLHVKSYLQNESTWTSTGFDQITKAFGFPRDGNPDEFVFNVNGLSGSFYMDHNGQWKVKSRQNLSLKVESEITNFSSFGESQYLPVSFLKFILTDKNGTQYTFGGPTNAIEMSTPTELGAWMYINGTYNAEYNGLNIFQPAWDLDFYQRFPVAWYLTEIRALDGEKITFNYTKNGTTLSATNFILDSSGPGVHSPQPSPYPSYNSFATPSYLYNIVTPTEEVVFNKTPSEYLEVRNNINYQSLFPAIGDGYYKLVSIDVKDRIDNSIVKTMAFNYDPNTNQRIKLKSVKIGTGLNSGGEYNFNYNSLFLPDYLSGFTDHWGYFNGKAPANVTQIAQFYNSKEPDSNYLHAEILTSIKNPTGGTSTFFYEPKFYEKVATQYPFAVNPQTGYADGLRIKKIVDDPVIGEVSTREFFYVSSGFNAQNPSSGVLSGNPLYHYYSAPKEIYQNTPVNLASSTSGKNVTYSRVVEKDATGYKVYSYSNLDNGYQDLPAIRTDNFLSYLSNFSSRELSRGNLLKEEKYSTAYVKVYQKDYDYNENLNQNVRAVGRGGAVGYQNSPAAAFYHYTFTPYVKSSVETIYENSGALINTTNYLYDPISSTLKRIIVNGGTDETVNTYYKYPSELGDPNNPQNPMTFLTTHNVNNPVETVTTKIVNNVEAVASSSAITYKMVDLDVLGNKSSVPDQLYSLEVNSLIPLSTFTRYSSEYELFTNTYQRDVMDARMKPNLVMGYDFGLVSSQQSLGQPIKGLIWGYNKQRIIAETTNAIGTDIAYTSFEGNDQTFGGWQVAGTPTTDLLANFGRSIYELTNGQQILKAQLNPAKTYLISYWSKGDGITVNGSIPQTQGETLNGWTFFQHSISGVNSVTLATTNSTTSLDELKLYPKDALMKTSVFNPLVGLTSETDEKNLTIFYKYDEQGRLKTIADQHGNVIKAYNYNYGTQ